MDGLKEKDKAFLESKKLDQVQPKIARDIKDILNLPKQQVIEIQAQNKYFDDSDIELSIEERDKAIELSKFIDEDDPYTIMNFGNLIQDRINNTSDEVLDVYQKQKEHTDVDEHLENLIIQLGSTKKGELQLTKPNFISRTLKLYKYHDKKVQKKYECIRQNVEDTKELIVKDIDTLKDGLYQLDELENNNKANIKGLNIFIKAGSVKLNALTQRTIPQAIEEAERYGTQGKVDRVQDLVDVAQSLDAKLNDLRVTRHLMNQQNEQIRLMKKGNKQLIEKLHTSVTTTIPSWNSSILVALELNKQRAAKETQKSITDTTNSLIKNTADLLETTSVEVAREIGRGLVDPETLTYTTEKTINTFKKIVDISIEARQNRREAEQLMLSLREKTKEAKMDNFKKLQNDIVDVD